MEMLEFANIFPSLPNLIVVGLMSVIFIHVMKFLTSRYPIPGVTEIFAGV